MVKTQPLPSCETKSAFALYAVERLIILAIPIPVRFLLVLNPTRLSVIISRIDPLFCKRLMLAIVVLELYFYVLFTLQIRFISKIPFI